VHTATNEGSDVKMELSWAQPTCMPTLLSYQGMVKLFCYRKRPSISRRGTVLQVAVQVKARIERRLATSACDAIPEDLAQAFCRAVTEKQAVQDSLIAAVTASEVMDRRNCQIAQQLKMHSTLAGANMRVNSFPKPPPGSLRQVQSLAYYKQVSHVIEWGQC
jgi:hypothetical protein